MPRVLTRFATYQFDSNLRNSTMALMLATIFAVVIIAEIAVTYIRKRII